MAELLTPAQREAVENRGGKLLVSAAAGSGKTKVLVDRLMRYVLDANDPANLDEFLIITYTKAAAAELRGKIANKLSELMAQQPENRHLQRQMQRLYLAKISTVHSFCSELLRENAYRLDIPVDFRIAEESECRELKEAALEQVLEEAYRRVDELPAFRAFVDTQGMGRSDAAVPDIVNKVYENARCHLDPDGWLDECLIHARITDDLDPAETVWGKYLIDDLFNWLDGAAASMERCADFLSQDDLCAKPEGIFRKEAEQLRYLRSAETWDELVQRKQVKFGTLTFPKNYTLDPLLVDRMKAVRKFIKEELAKRIRPFTDDAQRVLQDLHSAEQSAEGLVELVRSFDKAYAQAKRRRRVLDYSDLEQCALELLLGKDRTAPTRLAREVGNRFREVMVDEYQDSNAVQDAIFGALTEQRQNCFMVGDVKQAIYQFRLADPRIFLKKYHTFTDASAAQPGEGRKVLLSSNFRSGGVVLEAVNDVCSRAMSPELGGLVYGEEEALREGVPHEPLGEPEVELHVLQSREESYAEEADYTAERILELLNGRHMIRGKDGLRPILPEDIVILMRSPGVNGRYFQEALQLRGIRCETGRGLDLLQTPEISVLRSMLQIIVNPRQDIPLVAVLMSPLFCFTADDMARYRSVDRHSRLFDALLLDHSEKVREFVLTLERLRRKASLLPLSELLEQVLVETRVDSVYAAMSDSRERAEHLQQFFAQAVSFESTGRRDLQQFLDYLEGQEQKGLSFEKEPDHQGSVTLMSIHKSKGLEFPVVFLCALGKHFNQENLQSVVMTDSELGLGLSALDPEQMVRYPTIARRALAAKAKRDGMAEELRVLYVAMTRARDRLIMVYSSRYLKSDLGKITQRMGLCTDQQIALAANSMGHWVLQEALSRSEAGELFALGGYPPETRVPPVPWKIVVGTSPEQPDTSVEAVQQAMFDDCDGISPEILERLRHSLGFRYAHSAATRAPSKQTATQRKGRSKDQEAAEQAPEAPQTIRSLRKPSFAGGEQTQGKTVGNAMHAAMQFIRYENCTSDDAVRREVERMTAEGLLTAEQGSLVRVEQIATFFRSLIGQKLRSGGEVLREFKFSVLDDGSRYGEGLEGEQVLLQGVVDCALLEPDGITVLDFKTDYATEENLDVLTARYAPQVEAYAEAMERIFDRPVKEKLLYFFRLNRLITL